MKSILKNLPYLLVAVGVAIVIVVSIEKEWVPFTVNYGLSSKAFFLAGFTACVPLAAVSYFTIKLTLALNMSLLWMTTGMLKFLESLFFGNLLATIVLSLVYESDELLQMVLILSAQLLAIVGGRIFSLRGVAT
jgi:hypothetical protein